MAFSSVFSTKEYIELTSRRTSWPAIDGSNPVHIPSTGRPSAILETQVPGILLKIQQCDFHQRVRHDKYIELTHRRTSRHKIDGSNHVFIPSTDRNTAIL